MVIFVKYAFFIDLEGTLLSDLKKINSLSVNILNDLAKNNTVVLTSSMSFNEMINLISSYDLNLNIYSTNEGIGLFDRKLSYDEIDYDFLDNIADGIYTAILENRDEMKIINYQDRLDAFYPKCKNMLSLKPTVITISIFNEFLDDLLHLIESKEYSYNIIGKDNKKTLLKISKNGLTKANSLSFIKDNSIKTIAISDSYSDLDLLNMCDIKIAMKNSDEKLKKYADIITDFDNNNDGCMKALLEFINKNQ